MTLVKRTAALLVIAGLAGCGVQRRATDPAPTLPTLTETERISPSPEPPPVLAPLSVSTGAVQEAIVANPAAPAAVVDEPKRESPTMMLAKPRVWGLVEITTQVISPSQLMGEELPYSKDYKKLPAFPEKAVLAVSWGLLSVGEATLGVDKIVRFNGRPAYHLVSEARSNSFCDTFYPVRDLNESWLDARTLTSLGYSKKLREGHFFRDEWVLYDRDSGTFVSRRTNLDGSFSVRVGTIPAAVQDILSSVYYTRVQGLPEGGEVTVDVNTPDNWPLVVKVMGRESVSVPVGRSNAILVEPAMRKEGLFIQKGKRLRLWLSDDAYRRPLMLKVEVFFGHVTAVLREML